MNHQGLDSEIEIIKWVESVPSAEPPRVGEVNEERLLGLLWQHRLGMRFQERIRERRPAWCSRTMAFSVMQQCRVARENVRRQLAVNAEVLRALPDCAPLLITVKGVSTYALTGCERNIHASGDIDLMFHDLPLLQAALNDLGFAGKPHQVPAHEYSSLTRADMKIEPHIYFPVFCYPPERLADIVPAHNPDWWVQNTSNCLRRRITYDDVVAQCQRGNAPGTTQMIVPNPSMAVLIHCAHEFREYLQRPCRLTMIRLNSLMDIRDLIACKVFNSDLFSSLVEKFDGGDSVQLVRMLMRDYFGKDPFPFLPDVVFPAGYSSFPQFLSYNGVWVQLDEKADDLLSPLTMKALFRQLPPNIIEAASSASPKSYGGMTTEGEEVLTRVMIQTMIGAQLPTDAGFPLLVSSQWDADGLTTTFTLLEPLEEGYDYSMKLYSLDGISATLYMSLVRLDSSRDSSPQYELKQSIHENESASLDGTKCRLKFFLPLNQPLNRLPWTWREKGYLQATFMIVRRRRDEYENGDPVMMLPLHIVKA